MASIQAAVPDARVEIRELDLADTSSIRAFAQKFLQGTALDWLIGWFIDWLLGSSRIHNFKIRIIVFNFFGTNIRPFGKRMFCEFYSGSTNILPTCLSVQPIEHDHPGKVPYKYYICIYNSKYLSVIT